MRRREFIAGLGSAAVSPLVARSQQSALPVIGFLNGRSLDDFAGSLALFRQALGKAGYVEGRNVTIEYRWAEGHIERLGPMAVDLAQRRVNVILAAGGIEGTLAAKAATTTIPIVFLHGGDPVALGIVASLNRPGGNVTGLNNFADELDGKRLQILLRLVPKAVVVAVLVNPNNIRDAATRKEIQEGARSLGIQSHFLSASSKREIDEAFARMVELRADALFVEADPYFGRQTKLIVALAARHRIPAGYWFRSYTEAGGLMSYGANAKNDYQQIAEYVVRILKGTKPANLPVQRSTKFELILNRRTARTLGLEIPPTLLALVDEVIE
jgi:putative tryptophan/tyrosine transport system substrate-binding protein